MVGGWWQYCGSGRSVYSFSWNCAAIFSLAIVLVIITFVFVGFWMSVYVWIFSCLRFWIKRIGKQRKQQSITNYKRAFFTVLCISMHGFFTQTLFCVFLKSPRCVVCAKCEQLSLVRRNKRDLSYNCITYLNSWATLLLMFSALRFLLGSLVPVPYVF